MTLTQLRYVITIADTGSMNEASKALFISQPSLSQAVKELETEIGVELFKRSNRGVSVTQEGIEFRGYARHVVEQYELNEYHYIERKNVNNTFGLSRQHETFAVYVYLWKGHPLANKEEISIEELEEYPCLAFEQGNYNSFYFAEEVLSTYEYKRLIRANDRATLLNLMVGLNAYTLCCGIICEGLNGEDYCAVKLKSNEHMTIGYLKRKGVALSPLGQKYLEEIRKYKAMGMDIRGVEDIKADQKQS